jgi:hypothetical protein
MHEQGSQEWLLERCGKVTASRIADLMAKTKTGWGASRANYCLAAYLRAADRLCPGVLHQRGDDPRDRNRTGGAAGLRVLR